MNNLAASYSDLGRHEEALEMKEKTLEFRRRVLPENHPDIGDGHTPPLIPFYFEFYFCLCRPVVIQHQPQLL